MTHTVSRNGRIYIRSGAGDFDAGLWRAGVAAGGLEVPDLRQSQLQTAEDVQQHALPHREVQEGRLVVPKVPQPQLCKHKNLRNLQVRRSEA